MLVCIELIPTPLELLIETKRCCVESNPFNGATTSTSIIVWFLNTGLNETLSTTVLVSGLKSNRLGADVKSDPPFIILTLSTTSRLSILTTEGIKASGLSVLSAEYSYPKSFILTSFILPIWFDIGIRLAFCPKVDFTDLNLGNFS